jgi:hypothetical protein
VFSLQRSAFYTSKFASGGANQASCRGWWLLGFKARVARRPRRFGWAENEVRYADTTDVSGLAAQMRKQLGRAQNGH